MMKLRNTVCFFLTCFLAFSLSACNSKKDALGPSNDKVAGTAWVSTGDGSYMTFTGENNFDWYLDKDVTDDNYFKGTYEFYIGKAALNYLTVDLNDFGITNDEMEKIFQNNKLYNSDNFIVYTVHNTSFMLDGEEQLTKPQDTHYFGFLLDDDTYLDIANMTTGTYYGFEKE